MPLPASRKTVTATFTRADTAGPAAGSVQITPITPGDRHIVSTYAAAHRCSVCIIATYLDADYNAISGQTFNSSINDAGSGYSINSGAYAQPRRTRPPASQWSVRGGVDRVHGFSQGL